MGSGTETSGSWKIFLYFSVKRLSASWSWSRRWKLKYMWSCTCAPRYEDYNWKGKHQLLFSSEFNLLKRFSKLFKIGVLLHCTFQNRWELRYMWTCICVPDFEKDHGAFQRNGSQIRIAVHWPCTEPFAPQEVPSGSTIVLFKGTTFSFSKLKSMVRFYRLQNWSLKEVHVIMYLCTRSWYILPQCMDQVVKHLTIENDQMY